MKTVTNNEGKKIQVTPETYAEMQQAYNEGMWAMYIRCASDKPHMVIIPNNFT